MLLGDVLATVSLVFTTAFALLCAMLLSALLFPVRTKRAATEIQEHPWKCAITGFLVGSPVVLLGLVLFQIPHPVTRLLGGGVTLALVLIAAAGSGGMARLVGRRLDERESNFSIALGAFLTIGAALLPLAGWLLVAPLMLIVSLGAGFRCLPAAKQSASAVPETP